MRRLLLTLATGALLLGAAVAPASAHGDLAGGSPGPGDEVAPGVEVLRLDVDDLDPDGPAYLALLDDAGDPIAVGAASAVDAGTVCARTESLSPGVHTLEWAARSDDGHQTGGRYLFEVSRGGEAGDPGACDGTDLAAPGEAETLAEMTTGDGFPSWVVWLLVALAVLAAAGVVVRVVRDRREPRDDDGPGPPRGGTGSG